MENYSLTTFFLIFTIVPVLFALFAILLHPVIKKWMGRVK